MNDEVNKCYMESKKNSFGGWWEQRDINEWVKTVRIFGHFVFETPIDYPSGCTYSHLEFR